MKQCKLRAGRASALKVNSERSEMLRSVGKRDSGVR